jgi:hypothetical protein
VNVRVDVRRQNEFAFAIDYLHIFSASWRTVCFRITGCCDSVTVNYNRGVLNNL